MSTINIFLSYARRNIAAAVDLERALEGVGVGVWRDQEKLYAGARWPKDLGEAVAGNDALVLVWTESAAESKFVELEWCTALALDKPVLPYLLDQTPLPPVLASFHGLEAEDAAKDAPRLVERLRSQPETRVGQSNWLLTALEQIRTDEPDKAFETVRGLLTSAATNVTGQSIDFPHDREASTSPFAPGAVIGDRYEIKQLLGKGGLGDVWRAFDLKIRVDVALKVLHRAADEKALEDLRREVRTARDVASSNVCRIYDLGEADGVEFLSMEYVDGRTLAALMASEGPMQVEEASPLASQILSGLQAIHDAGLVHRDIKPENLMVTRTGRVVVMDLGLARWRTDDAVFSVSGTPAYMAPEQLRGDQADGRCDVYAAGVVLAELTAPDGARDLAQRQAIWTGIQQDPPRLPDTPWAQVLAKAVEGNPSHRFPSAQDLSRALEKLTLQTTAEIHASPYPGLSAFTAEEAEYFFGREAEIEALWTRLCGPPRLLGVVGPSGAGKSSFLQAGLIAHKPDEWRHLICQPNDAPLRSLGKALAAELAGDHNVMQDLVQFDDPDAAVRVIERWRGDERALLIVDQFEELFTLNPSEAQERFAALLGRLPVEANVHVLLSMRDDFLYRCHAHDSLSPILSELTLLGPPTGEGLRRAIVQPALKCGHRFDDEALVDEMLDEVEGERGALPLLAFACAQLWEKRDKDQGLLTREVYQEIGGVAGALAGHAEATLDRIGQDRLPLVRELFRNLVTAEGTRAERDRDELLSVFPEDDREAAAEVLDELIDARLLVSYEQEDEEQERHRIEIIHESLLESWPRLVRWQTQDADAAQMRDQLRQAAKMWEERDRAEDLLWSGTAFREFQVWRENYPGRLSETEQAFAAAMEAKATRQRRQRRLAGAMVIVLALAIAGATSLLWQRSETARQLASEEARRAEASKLLAIAELRREEDPTEALAYTTASLELADSREARLFALRILWEVPPAFELMQGGQHARFLAFNPEGNRLAGGEHKGQVRVWPDDGGKPEVLQPKPTGSLVSRWLSSELLVTGRGTGNRVMIWNAAQGELLRTIDFGGASSWQAGEETLFAQTPEGESDGGVVRSWQLPHGEPVELGRVTPPDRSAFLRNGDGWIYARDDSVYFRPLPSKGAGGNDRLLGRHPANVVKVGALGSEPDKIYSSDQAGGIRIWSFSGNQPELVNVIPSLDTESLYRIPAPSLRWALGDFWSTKDRQARLWNLGPWREARPLTLRRSGAWYLARPAFHPQSRWLVVSTKALTHLTFWPLIDRFPRVVDGYESIQRPISFSPDGRWLATSWSAPPGDRLRLWPLPGSDVRKVRELKLPERGVWVGLAFDPEGRFLFIHRNGGAAIVPLDGSQPRQLQDVPDGVLWGAAVSPSGRRVATAIHYGQGQKTLHVWDLEAETMETFNLPPGSSSSTGYEGSVNFLAFAGETTIYTAGDGGVRRLDLVNDTRVLVFATQAGFTVEMAIGPDGKRAAIKERPLSPEPGYRSDVKMLDLASGEVQPLPGFTACKGRATVAISRSLVADYCEGTIRVGRPEQEPHLLPGHDGPVQFVAISPDERWIASTAEDNTLRLWPMPDLDQPPLHTVPRDELIAKLKSLTNIRVERDPDSAEGWKVELDEFPGWAEVPEW